MKGSSTRTAAHAAMQVKVIGFKSLWVLLISRSGGDAQRLVLNGLPLT